MKLILSAFLLLLIASCEKKDSVTVVDEYTGKKVLPFVQQRVIDFASKNFWDVSFKKDTIVLYNDTYNMPVLDTFTNDTAQLFTKYLQPLMKKFRLEVYYEMFGYSKLPMNEINTAFLTKTMFNPSNTYGNMTIKIIHNLYIKRNGEYEEMQIVFYYNAEDDFYYTHFG